MKKLMVIGAMVFTLIFSVPLNANAEFDNAEFGLGYEGMLAGNFFQGISARGWLDKLGCELNLFHATVDMEVPQGTVEFGDIWIFSGKILFAAVVNQNSKFYLGFDAGIGSIGFSDDEFDVISYGPLFGAEYRFQGISELGFNWEVGYKFNDLNNVEYEGEDVKLGINGINISIGVHYYF